MSLPSDRYTLIVSVMAGASPKQHPNMPLDRMKLRTFPFSKSIGNMKPSITIFLPLSALISFGNGSRAPLSLVCGQYRNWRRANVSVIGLSSTGGAGGGAGFGASTTGLGSGFGSGFTSGAAATTGFGSGLGSGWTSGTTGGGSGFTGGGSTGLTGTSNDVPWTLASGTGAA